jgi:hypothetical protein
MQLAPVPLMSLSVSEMKGCELTCQFQLPFAPDWGHCPNLDEKTPKETESIECMHICPLVKPDLLMVKSNTFVEPES